MMFRSLIQLTISRNFASGRDQTTYVVPYSLIAITVFLIYKNKKNLKNVGSIGYCEPPLHCQSPGVASRTPAITIAHAACDVHDINNNNNNNDNA